MNEDNVIGLMVGEKFSPQTEYWFNLAEKHKVGFTWTLFIARAYQSLGDYALAQIFLEDAANFVIENKY